jgi:hypothetical protein
VNERNLSRRLAAGVVDTLKARGHILVVKGGATAFARELDELMAPEITTIAPRLKPRTPLVGEPTSTFGDEAVDQAVEDMVVKLTQALMNSDHVEDVFAEDAVIRRDIFRVMRDGLREPPGEGAGDDLGGHTSVTVKLDALGYVAATASRRADAATLRLALDRAASVAHARFSGFSPELREATFRLDAGGLDERLEIEEAVADELTDLVEQGLIALPTLERRLDLGRALTPTEQRTLRPRLDAAFEGTLLRAGCAAAWALADARTIRVLFTPLSEQDASGIDVPLGAFAREIAAILPREGRAAPEASPPTPRSPVAEGRAPSKQPAAPPAPEPSEPAPPRRATRAKKKEAAAEAPSTAPTGAPPKRSAAVKKRAVESAPEAAPRSPRKAVAASSGKAAPRPTAKRAPAKATKAKVPAKKR